MTLRSEADLRAIVGDPNPLAIEVSPLFLVPGAARPRARRRQRAGVDR